MSKALPPLPKPDTHCFDEDAGKDVWSHSPEQMQAYATAATEPLLQRIAHLEATASANYGRGHADAHSMLSERVAELERRIEAGKNIVRNDMHRIGQLQARVTELEQRNSDLREDVQRFKKHALNEKAVRLELERQLDEARNQALEEAAKVCEEKHANGNWKHDTRHECAAAIRALKGAKE